ncbi:Hopanoid C-2 methylase [Zhongshania aliphaticivorans]|uniref:Hopanoid C-2 methylase n=1 Tax=Zhongshania aliphaticivorans TaxID=1470434 RepID=A0A5S9P170_9GAMM|nr:cobalamin-dependent protein [Zhongshania aliphaticivorans]CAA0089747.1 Hopanoid C-2 methylase [Zhongshania aliphaticivorans]CAA0096713.1 Hopanoid C-2 methylase [Zhongshania aliphaticivorans]
MTKGSTGTPVLLFSMDSDQFWAAPTTTGGLKAYYQQYGKHTEHYNIELIHFKDDKGIVNWQKSWQEKHLPAIRQASQSHHQAIVGFSMYTWNAAEFLALIHQIKTECPNVLCIAGGPHVQQAEDYLGEDPIDIIILGEGESTFTEILDQPDRKYWSHIKGIAFLDNGTIKKTEERQRRKCLDELPSPLDAIELTDAHGKPLYDSISYETSRGCPFKCAFCEWGTGAIGSKMYQFSMTRVRSDWHRIVDAGIKDIWLADSNFGALKEDLEKAQLICELKQKTGLPSSFATSWSKKHSPRVQEIVLLLHKNGLLPHYQLALQTLTPLALELSNRKNMAANKYIPIAQQMAIEGVPIAAELIWGLPGDNLADFESNLDELLKTFPNLNIFAYTLLPGTEFYEKRNEYQIETIPVAGYGKAKGEYVVACHTFDRNEGIEGYFLITAHILFAHGHIIPLAIRFLALHSEITTAPLLRELLRIVCAEYQADMPDINLQDRMTVYEHRATLFTTILQEPERLYSHLEQGVLNHLKRTNNRQLITATKQILAIDHALSPRCGEASEINYEFSFDAISCKTALDCLSIPSSDDLKTSNRQTVAVKCPGGLGTILKDPDGGAWLRGEFQHQIAEVQTVRIIHPNIKPAQPIEQ